MNFKVKIVLLGIVTFVLNHQIVGQDFSNDEDKDAPSINQTDKNNNKQGKWIFFFENNPSLVCEEGGFIDNQKTGVWKTYYPNKNLKSEITYKNGQPNGYAKLYYENGELSEEGNWSGAYWTGEYRFYHRNGNLRYNWFYTESGDRNGIQKYFYQNGALRIIGAWSEGEENGLLIEYFADGRVKSEKIFKMGKIVPGNDGIYANNVDIDKEK